MSDNDEIQNYSEKPKFVEFGYIDFDKGVLWFMPHFHYLVAKDETCFMAINLETQLFTVDDTQRKALDFLYDLIMSHIKDVAERGDFAQLIETAKSNEMDECWHKYREMEFTAAQKAFNNRKKDAVSKVEIVEG